MKILLSYPRSGNHLVRFIIEYLTDEPTIGCLNNLSNDKPIYKNYIGLKDNNDNNIFNINDNINNNLNILNLFIKFHMVYNVNKFMDKNNISNDNNNKLIILIRNPREVLLRQNNYKPLLGNKFGNYNSYFEIINFYNNFNGKKLKLYFEDFTDINNKGKISDFINTLYDFLEIKNKEKKEYLLKNIDEYYNISSNNKSNGFSGIKTIDYNNNYHYNKCSDNIKPIINNYLKKQILKKENNFLSNKYILDLKNYI
jgi:hypothetical protein